MKINLNILRMSIAKFQSKINMSRYLVVPNILLKKKQKQQQQQQHILTSFLVILKSLGKIQRNGRDLILLQSPPTQVTTVSAAREITSKTTEKLVRDKCN